MSDNTELLERIEPLRIAKGLRHRGLCVAAGISVDWFKLRRKGHPPRREELRALAGTLGCELSYLEEAAPDVRLDSRTDDELTEWLDLYGEVPALRRRAFISAARAMVRLMDAESAEPEEIDERAAKKGRR